MGLIALAMVSLLAGCGGPPGPEPIFCYRTIGQPECHARALPGEENRLITVGPKYP